MKLKSRRGKKSKMQIYIYIYTYGNKQEIKCIIEKLLNAEMEQD